MLSALMLTGSVFVTSCSKDDEGESVKNMVVNGHEAVDLGLPSGTKWATANLGATSVDDRGDFYQWGETGTCTSKDESLNWNSNYTPGNTAVSDLSICGTSKDPLVNDNIISLDGLNWTGNIAGNAMYDAATKRWGGSWTMPTEEQIKELCTACTWTQEKSINGILGYKVKGRNGKSIFLPLGGYRKYLNLDRGGSMGGLWSASISSTLPAQACYLIFENNDATSKGRVSKEDRYMGFNIRPVTMEKVEPK